LTAPSSFPSLQGSRCHLIFQRVVVAAYKGLLGGPCYLRENQCMDRVAVLVDAGYFFAAGSALVSGSGNQRRDSLIFDEKSAVKELEALAQRVAQNSPLLRIYWYDGASRKTGPTAEHSRLAHSNNIKVRLGFLNSAGQQKGVDSLIVTDLVELARNRAVGDVVLVSGDEDVRIGVQLAQSFGVRVHLVGVKPCAGNQSPELRQEADTCTELDISVLKKIISMRQPAVSPATPAAVANKRPASVAKSTSVPPSIRLLLLRLLPVLLPLPMWRRLRSRGGICSFGVGPFRN